MSKKKYYGFLSFLVVGSILTIFFAYLFSNCRVTYVLYENESIVLKFKKNELIDEIVEPQRDSYDFKGWYLDSNYNDLWDFSSDRVVEDTILYAKWQKYYEVIFFVEGIENQKIKVYENEDLFNEEMPTASKEGYEFLGWYDSIVEQGSNRVDYILDIDSNVSLFARFTTIS